MTGLMLRPKLSTRSTEICESPPVDNNNAKGQILMMRQTSRNWFSSLCLWLSPAIKCSPAIILTGACHLLLPREQSDLDNCSCLETFNTNPRPTMRSFPRSQFGECSEEERRPECRSSPDRPSSVRILSPVLFIELPLGFLTRSRPNRASYSTEVDSLYFY